MGTCKKRDNKHNFRFSVEYGFFRAFIWVYSDTPGGREIRALFDAYMRNDRYDNYIYTTLTFYTIIIVA